MLVGLVIHKLKAGLLFLIDILKRSLCCLRRRRKSSVDCVPLTGIGIVPNDPLHDPTLQDVSWKDWDEEGSAPPGGHAVVGELHHAPHSHPPPHPGSGYHHQQQMQQQQQNQQQPDFFRDMEPEIKRQTTMLVKVKPDGQRAKRLSMSATSGGSGSGGGAGSESAAAAARLACHDLHFTSHEGGSELGNWEEGEGDDTLWSDAELGWDVVLRHQRNMERHQRKSTTDQKRSTLTLATKLSSPITTPPQQQLPS